jgi:hypothetical protein
LHRRASLRCKRDRTDVGRSGCGLVLGASIERRGRRARHHHDHRPLSARRLYELVRNHLGGIEDFWVALERTEETEVPGPVERSAAAGVDNRMASEAGLRIGLSGGSAAEQVGDGTLASAGPADRCPRPVNPDGDGARIAVPNLAARRRSDRRTDGCARGHRHCRSPRLAAPCADLVGGWALRVS